MPFWAFDSIGAAALWFIGLICSYNEIRAFKRAPETVNEDGCAPSRLEGSKMGFSDPLWVNESVRRERTEKHNILIETLTPNELGRLK